MEFYFILFIYTVLANAKPLFHMSLRTTKGSHKIILFILQYCSLFSLSVTAYRRATSLVRERLALIVLFTKERLDREVSLMNSIIRQGSPCEGGGAGVLWTPLPQAKAPTEPTGETCHRM